MKNMLFCYEILLLLILMATFFKSMISFKENLKKNERKDVYHSKHFVFTVILLCVYIILLLFSFLTGSIPDNVLLPLAIFLSYLYVLKLKAEDYVKQYSRASRNHK